MRVAVVIIASAITVGACSRGTRNNDSPAESGSPAPSTGCTKDTDCKGDRICQNGQCGSPTAAVTAASPTPAPQPAPPPVGGVDHLTDPFAYCAAVGTADEVDARYSGPKEPQAIRNQLTMDGMFTWRCDLGKVMACSYGANLPCGKANVNRVPDAAEAQFCKENPNGPGIPAVITGHNTLFVWTCQHGNAVIERQPFHSDDRGFVKEFWYEIRRP